MVVYEDTPKLVKLKDEMIKRGDFELMATVEGPSIATRVVKDVPVIEDEFECPICGKVVPDEEGLKKHRKTHK